MNILIGLLGTASMVDYTEKMLESNEIVLTQERERGAFERTADDVRLIFSDIDKTFTNLFKQKPSTSRFRVHVMEGTRILFRGEIEWTSIEFDVVEETVSMNVYSLERRFWELAKVTRIVSPYHSYSVLHMQGEGYQKLENVIKIETGRVPFNDLFNYWTISSLYANRPIRNSTDASGLIDKTIGNNGRIKELRGEMTVAELLEGFALYYNAEFFIDAETNNFNMQRRAIILNDVNADITNLVLEESSFTVGLIDEDKYNYVATEMKLPRPVQQLTYSSIIDYAGGIPTIEEGGYHYVMTHLYGDNLLESEACELLLSISASSLFYASKGFKITLTVPLGDAGTTARKIYRREWKRRYEVQGEITVVHQDAITEYYYVGTLNDNSTTTFIDYANISIANRIYLPQPLQSPRILFGYDETTNTWLQPITDDGSQEQPDGKIFDATPKIEFRAINNPNENLGIVLSHIADFFGGKNDFNLQNFIEQWRDMMLSRKLKRVTVDGMNYRIGDSVVNNYGYHGSEIIGQNRFIVRKASSNLNELTTELELVTA